MGRQTLSLADIQGKLSRADMKKIMAGDNEEDNPDVGCATSWDPCDNGACTLSDGTWGKCYKNTAGTKCYCGAAT